MKTNSYNYVTLDTLVDENILAQSVLDNISETNVVTFGDAYDTLITSRQLDEIAHQVGDIDMSEEELENKPYTFFDFNKYQQVYGDDVLI
ncbi:MAG: hypothetical protein GWN62_13990, partial [Aliifodinibius sp.]|nr:hypothetical protein [Fodinibius sp.]